MARVARAVHCELAQRKQVALMRRSAEEAVPAQVSVPKVLKTGEQEGKILLQPRLCTLRSFAEDRVAVVQTRRDKDDMTSPFFETLSEYIENSMRTREFEIISGRLAMIVFAATVTTEMMTGNSVFSKLDVEGIEEAFGACLAAVACAAILAWFSSARNRVGRIFSISCNSFIDSLIDEIVDGLFYNSELSDWSNEI